MQQLSEQSLLYCLNMLRVDLACEVGFEPTVQVHGWFFCTLGSKEMRQPAGTGTNGHVPSTVGCTVQDSTGALLLRLRELERPLFPKLFGLSASTRKFEAH